MARSHWAAGSTEATRATVSLSAIEGGSRPARKFQPILRLCEEQCRAYEREIALMETKTISTLECRDGVMVDTTTESIARVKQRLAELDTLLAEHGETRRGERGVLNSLRVVERLGQLLALARLK
jgi:hypothetical protein